MTGSSPDFAAPLLAFALSSVLMVGLTFSFAGDIGMVSRGTGELGLTVVGAVSIVAMREERWARANQGKRKLAKIEVNRVSVAGLLTECLKIYCLIGFELQDADDIS